MHTADEVSRWAPVQAVLTLAQKAGLRVPPAEVGKPVVAIRLQSVR